MGTKSAIKPFLAFDSKSDWHQIYFYNITSDSHIKVTRIKKKINKDALDCLTNSPCQHLGDCMENSMENKQTVVRVYKVHQ